MRILGIDPGLATLGWGVIESEGSKNRLVDCGAILTPPDHTMPDRLLQIHNEMNCILNRFEPDEIVFEELFFAKNITTAMNVSAARGVALSVCAAYGSPLYEYTPMQIKQAVVGYGKAEKMQVQQMVRMILSLPDIIRPDDTADAVAAALTHASAGRMRDQFKMK